MSTSKRKIFLSSLGALAVTLLLAASSWSMPHGGRGHDPEKMLAHMTQRLDLTEQQQTEVGALLTEAHEQGQADSKRLKELRSTLRDQLKAFDAQSLQAAADEIGALTSRQVYARTSTHAQIYALLDERQQAKMEKLQEKRKMRKWHKRAHRDLD